MLFACVPMWLCRARVCLSYWRPFSGLKAPHPTQWLQLQ